MKTLVLTEKPSVARDIARVLGCKNNQNGGIIGDKYIITWALGHLVTLAMPEELDPKWKVWNQEMLPLIPKYFKTKVIKASAKQFNCVKNFMKSDVVDSLIIATDAGREGELVARWIINQVGFNKPMKRLWISSMTDQAIKDGFKHLVDAEEYRRLYDAAFARAKADWLVGLNATRALTCKYNVSLSAGRVQTPTLSLIVEREKAIKSFVPKTYYKLNLKFKCENFELITNNNAFVFNQYDDAYKVLTELKMSTLTVLDITKTMKKSPPPLLYDLTSLQQDANKIYGYSAKYTLNLVQSLYEIHKYLTYPRTDSKYLSTDMFLVIKDRIKNASYEEYRKYADIILSKELKNNKRIFDNSKVSDHHAIIPTELKPNINSLSLDEKRIYDLVLKRFLAAFMDDYEYEIVKVTIGNGQYQFRCVGCLPKNLGYRMIISNEEENSILKTTFTKGEIITNPVVTIKQGLTSPKERYTEATLLDAMENAGRYTNNTQEKQILVSASGIGTPATRADIIERLFEAGYAKKIDKSIYATDKGMQLIDLVPELLTSVSLTAQQELKLSLIGQGKLNEKTFISDICELTKNLTNKILNANTLYHYDNITTSKCPNCGYFLLDEINNKGETLVCSNRECDYRRIIYRISKLRCPNCHKNLKEIGTKEKLSVQCQCGFKMNKERFIEQLNNNKQNINNKIVRKILAKQEEEIPKNNPFAALLKEVKDE